MPITVNTNFINQSDQYLLDAKNVKGTYVVVENYNALSSLPAATTVSGSLAYCQEAYSTYEAGFYQYNGTSWDKINYGTYTKPNGGIPDSDLASDFVKTVNSSSPDAAGDVTLDSDDILVSTSSSTTYGGSSITNAIDGLSGRIDSAGTVTSVQVQAGDGLVSSQDTAQTSTLDTTISIDSNYKLQTNEEYKDSSLYWIAPTGYAGVASAVSTRWVVNDVAGFTEPYNGMKVMLRIPVAGVGTAGTMMSIDGGSDWNTYHPIAYNLNTAFTTHYPVNTNKIFVYNATQTMTAYWMNPLTTQPSDWATKYNTYYQASTVNTDPKATWTLVSGSSAPTFVNNKYAKATSKSYTGVWQGESNYDSNTTMTYGTLAYYFRPYVAQALYRYKLVMLDKDNRVVPLTTTNNAETAYADYSSSTTYAKDVAVHRLSGSVGRWYKSLQASNKGHAPESNPTWWEEINNKTPTTLSFRPDKIYWYNTTATVNAGSVIGGNSLMDIGYGQPYITYCNFNKGILAYRVVYLCGTYDKTTGLFTLNDSGVAGSDGYYVQVPDNTANLTLSEYFISGKDYILVGGSYSSNNYLHLRDDHPMFHFDGENLVPYDTYNDNRLEGLISQSPHGTVTHVGLALPIDEFSITNSPVTSEGTLTGSWKTQNANKVFAGPTSGSDAAPTFRALTTADIPALNYQAPLPTTAEAGKVLKSTSSAGTVEWGADNNTTYTFAEGSTNKAFSVTASGGSAQTVYVHGLGDASLKDVSTSVSPSSTNDTLATSKAVQDAINNLPSAMIFKGTLGTDGTITVLPAASASNEGFTYKVITDGTYASQAAKSGDVFVSNGSAWVLIPAGDDVEDTWRTIKVNGTELLGNALSTGAVNFKNGDNVTVTGDGNDITINATIPSNNVVGSGTATHLPQWTDANTLSDTGVTINNEGVVIFPSTVTTSQNAINGDSSSFVSGVRMRRRDFTADNATTKYVYVTPHNVDYGRLGTTEQPWQQVYTNYVVSGVGKTNTDSASSYLDSLAYWDNTGVLRKRDVARISPSITPFDSNIKWGGPNLVDDVSPVDSGCIAELGSTNKLAFLNPDCITVEYSTNGGATWSDYEPTDAQKTALVTDGQVSWFNCGKVTTTGVITSGTYENYKVRVTISSRVGKGSSTQNYLYTMPKRWLLEVSTNGAGNCTVLYQQKTISAWEADADIWNDGINYSIAGYSGWNSIPGGDTRFGGVYTQTAQIAAVRFTFSIGSVASAATYTNALAIGGIRLIGTTNWITSSNMMASGHLYSFDTDQNAVFPANVCPKENLSGQTDSGSYLGTSTNRWMTVYTKQFNSNTNINDSSTVSSVAFFDVDGWLYKRSPSTMATALLGAYRGGTSGQVLLSGGSDAAPSWNTLAPVATTGSYNDLTSKPTISTEPTTGTGLWDANTIINYIASRGQQLMTNGTFLLMNNYNFSSMTYDGSDANASGGCVYKTGASTAAKNDEYIAIDKTKLYRLTYDLKPNVGFDAGTNTSAGINGFLPYLDQYDIDKNLIADTNTNYKAGTLVQLTRELKAGDTTMEVTDASAWTTFTSINATLQIWDYTNSKGYTYGPGEYTRHTFNMGTSSSASGNTITFANAYSGPTVAAGTYVSQNRGGGYAYIGSYDKPAAGVWTSCTHDTTSSTVRGGCAFAKIGWLWNYNVSNNTATAYAEGAAVPVGRIIKYDNKYYFCIKEVPANSSILPSDTEYYEGPYAGVTNGIKTKMTNVQFTVKSLT